MNLLKKGNPAFHIKNAWKAMLFDLLALLVVFFTPRIGELIHFPFYIIEPMRLMVILSIAHSGRLNSYLLAFILPLFSWAVSGHPEFYKMLVMTCELGANVFLFYFIISRTKVLFLSAILSIAISKVFCYMLYLVFFSMMFIEGEAEPFFLLAQVVTMLIFSAYLFFILKNKEKYRQVA